MLGNVGIRFVEKKRERGHKRGYFHKMIFWGGALRPHEQAERGGNEQWVAFPFSALDSLIPCKYLISSWILNLSRRVA